MLCEGLELAPGVTVLVGENGSGKSTIVEMLAEACGLNPQGGSAMGKLFRTRESEPGIGAGLVVERGPGRPHWSYFLRADTMHTLYSYLEDNPGRRPDPAHPVGRAPSRRIMAPVHEGAGLLLPSLAYRLTLGSSREGPPPFPRHDGERA
jgi:predicted ATPase